MTKKVFEPEDEEFGADTWKLLSRHVIDGQRTTVRVLPIQGRGVLVQTARQVGDQAPVYDEPVLVDKVLLMEYVETVPSKITDGNGNPTSVKVRVQGRELVDANVIRDRFQPKGKKVGPYANLTILPGVVLTLETRPQHTQVPDQTGA